MNDPSCTGTDGLTYYYAPGTPSPAICNGLLSCIGSDGNTYQYAATDPVPPLCVGVPQTLTPPGPSQIPTASASISSTGCAPGTGPGDTTISWSSTGVLPYCQISSNPSGVSGIPSQPSTSGQATITNIPRNGSPVNFTITCSNLAPGYSAHLNRATNSTSVTCQVACDPNIDPNHCQGGPNPTGTPHPIYKEN